MIYFYIYELKLLFIALCTANNRQEKIKVKTYIYFNFFYGLKQENYFVVHNYLCKRSNHFFAYQNILLFFWH